MKKRFFVGVIVLSLLLGGIIFTNRSPQKIHDTTQNLEPRLFSQTGHWVSGEFLKKYLQAEHPEFLYGSPITEPFYSNEAQRIVQYFENCRFELYPENPPELRVRVTPLGQLMLYHQPATAFNVSFPLARCRHFSETGVSVCHEFLDFFEKHGGVRIFGYPISDLLIQDGLIVQYFQLMRLEWVGHTASLSPIRVSPLGKRYFALVKEDQRLLAPAIENAAPQFITSMRLRGFPLRAVTSSAGTQTIFVLTQDQNDRPIANAQVGIRIYLPDGMETYPPSAKLSDNNGITRFEFPFQSNQLGLVIVQIQAQYDNLQAFGETSFRIWK